MLRKDTSRGSTAGAVTHRIVGGERAGDQAADRHQSQDHAPGAIRSNREAVVHLLPVGGRGIEDALRGDPASSSTAECGSRIPAATREGHELRAILAALAPVSRASMGALAEVSGVPGYRVGAHLVSLEHAGLVELGPDPLARGHRLAASITPTGEGFLKGEPETTAEPAGVDHPPTPEAGSAEPLGPHTLSEPPDSLASLANFLAFPTALEAPTPLDPTGSPSDQYTRLATPRLRLTGSGSAPGHGGARSE